MTRTVFTIRPEPGFSATLAAGRALGLEMAGDPLFDIQPVKWIAPSPDAFDALLLGSANAVRHGGETLHGWTAKPVYAVGKATADAARRAGFRIAAEGRHGLQTVLDDLAGRDIRFLRLAGEDHVDLTTPGGTELITRIVYASRRLLLAPSLAPRLQSDGVVLLHSARAAEHFAQECRRLGLDRSRLKLAALGSRIVHAAGPGWLEVRAAPRPCESALLALARDMCQ